MSRENVEIVRRTLEVYRAGDHDAYVELFAEDVEVCPRPNFPRQSRFVARKDFRRFVADIDQGFEGPATGDIQEISL